MVAFDALAVTRGDGSPDWLRTVTAAERPELWERTRSQRLFDRVWPEYNLHGDHTGGYFSTLVPGHAHLQVLLVDTRSQHVAARGRTIPFRWDGTLDDLPLGIDGVGLRAVTEPEEPTALSALAAEVDPGYRGWGLGGILLQTMATLARAAGLAPLLGPVRPSRKDRYPLVPIERYAPWVGEDGLPFDPWLAQHARLGARMLRADEHSLEITAPVEDWERWTATPFPDDGTYRFPGGLAPLTVQDGIGHYWEPCVWMLHEV